jgi:hypothetical protein
MTDLLDTLPFHCFRQIWDQPSVADVANAVRWQILQSKLRQRVRPGGRVAVAVGSRGIRSILALTRATVATLKEMGLDPFVVAAMGSHGGATPDGQRALLADYGITPGNLGVEVRTDMDVVELGRNAWNDPVYWDRNAAAAEGVIALARIKPHTDFHATFESGIVKMLVIGLGKQKGANTHHRHGTRGLKEGIPLSARVVLEKSPFALGLAVVENAHDEPAHIEAVEPEDLLRREPELLHLARSLQARLPFDDLDLLVVGEVGKNYSGTGMDTNVLGRLFVEGEIDPLQPKITRICLLDLSPESHGNATGIGLADLTTAGLLAKMDHGITRMNSLTSCHLMRSRIPFDFPTDRECILAGLRTCWQPDPDALRMAIIPNTLELEFIWATTALAKSLRGRQDVLPYTDPRPLPFTDAGTLRQAVLFPQSTQGRRLATHRG